jgi:general secretion pathway protein D
VPTTSSRTLSADITVSNRDTIMLGGFLSSSGTKSKSGVPLLKDIPILGGLFRSTSNSKDRKELVVLMRPTVLETPHMAAVGSADAQENMPGIHSFQKRLKKEDKDFQNKMDRLDGIKPGADDAAPPAKTKADAAQTSELKEAPVSPGATPDAAAPAPAETEWTNPAATPPATNGTEGFQNVRPMTDEEIKALGRDTHGQ